MSIRVLIADDQELIRAALAALLSDENDLEVVAQVGRGDEVVDAAVTARADVALLDIEMPGATGIEAAAALAEHVPECASIIVTTFGRPGYFTRALAAGARGFLVKDTPPSRLIDAVRRVHQGLRVVDPKLAEDALFTPENPLTDREVDVCRAAAAGADVRSLARQLHLSAGTVRNHLSSIIRKTGANNRFTAVSRAEDNGWL